MGKAETNSGSEESSDGGPPNLDAVYEHHGQYLLLIASQHLGEDLQSKFGASDLVQQSLLEAHASRDQFRGQSEQHLRAWLTQIVRRNAIDQARRYRATQLRDTRREVSWSILSANSLVASDATPSAAMLESERDRELLEAIEQLSPRDRAVIELRHKHGLSYVDIAEKLGISTEGVRKQWTRAIRRLQRITGASSVE